VVFDLVKMRVTSWWSSVSSSSLCFPFVGEKLERSRKKRGESLRERKEDRDRTGRVVVGSELLGSLGHTFLVVIKLGLNIHKTSKERKKVCE
jgi:hypothetical protein